MLNFCDVSNIMSLMVSKVIIFYNPKDVVDMLEQISKHYQVYSSR